MADVEAVAEVSAALSQKSLDALSLTISKALDKGLKGFGDKIVKALSGAGLNKIHKELAATAKKWADQYDRVGTQGARSLRGLTTGLGATNKETLKLVSLMEKLAQSQEVIGKAIAKAQSDFLQETRRANQLTIERTRLLDRAGQEQIEIARDVAKKEVVILQGAEQQKVVAARFAGQQRVQLTRAVIENIARLERGLAAVLAGFARTGVGAIGKAWEGLTSVVRRSARNITNISHSADLSITQSISQSLRIRGDSTRNYYAAEGRMARANAAVQERIARQSATRQAQTIDAIRRRSSAGVLGAATGRGIGPGLGSIGAGVGIGALLTSGFQRFSELERLNKQFLALTGNAEEAVMLMAQVKEFAKLTPFDLVGVAGLAKGFLAIGTAAEQVMSQVKAIADAVALTGGGVEQLDRIQRAIGQVVSTGKLQGDELNQLAENLPGLNIRKLLANQLTGGDVAKLVEMQAAGEISGEAFVDGLITGLQQDKRLVGASEDLAKTLGGIAANTKESFADLGASIIGLFAPQLKAAFKGAQMAMQTLADFIKGEGLSETLDSLRTTLGGVALGIAAIGALKGNIELFSLLGRAVSLVLTPLGLLVAAAGLVAGAIAFMMAESVPFRLALEALGDKFGEVGGRIKSFVMDHLEGLATFITKTVIPGLTHFADWLGARLLPAFEAVSRFIGTSVIPTIVRWAKIVVRDLVGAYRIVVNFITSKVIPVIETFVDFLRTEVFPVVADVARVIGHGFMEALGAVQRFGQRIRPFVQPAIEGFERLGRALSHALTGDFSTLGTGAMGALRGIGKSIVNLWDLAFETLRPLAQKALDLIKSVFTVDNLITAGKAVLDFVEWIGNTLGTIVTHPAFLAAVAGIVAAAGLVAIRFLEGFVRGVLTNILPMFGAIKDAFFDNWQIVLGVIAGGAALAFVVRQFRSMGAQAGGGFLSGLRTTMSGAVGLTQGVFSGRLPSGGSSLYASAQIKDLKAVEKQAAQLQSRLLTFGVQKLYDPTKSGILAMKNELRQVNKLLPESQRMGLLMRESFAAMGRVIATGLRVEGFAGAMKNFWASLRQQAAEGGPTVGRVLAQGIGTGLAIGFAGFTTGKFMGEAGQSPLMAILTGGFTGFALSGGNPIAAAVGALAAGIGGAIGASAKEAKDAKARIEGYADAIRSDLGDALTDGTTLLIGWNEALAGGDAGGFATTFRAQIKALVPILNDAGLSSREALEMLAKGEGGVDDLIHRLASRPGGAAGQFTGEFDLIRRVAEEMALAIQNADATLRDSLLGSGAWDGPFGFPTKQAFDAAAVTAGLKATKDAQAATRDLHRDLALTNAAWDDFGGGAWTATAKAEVALRVAAVDARKLYRNLADTNAAWDSFGDKPKPKTPEQVADDLEDAVLALVELNTEMDILLRDRAPTSLVTALRDLQLGLVGGGAAINLDGFLDDLELSAFKDDLVDKLSPIFAQAVSEGWAIDSKAFDPLAQQMLDSLMHGVEDPEGKIREQLAILMEELRVEIDKSPLTFNPTIDLSFDPSMDLGDVAFPGGDKTPKITLPKIKVAASDVDVDTAAITTKMDTAGSAAGRAMFSGMIRGLNIGKAGAKNTAVAAANDIVNAVNEALGIRSPSKVFQKIGEQIGEGLEIGIEDSVSTVGDKMADAIRSAVDRAVEAAKGGTAVLRSAGSSLFAALTGSGGALGGGSAIGRAGGWTLALQSFMEAAGSTVSKALAVATRKSEGEALTPGESNIFGESGVSLNLSDVLGAENVDALKGVLDTIAGFGSEMLDLGLPASDVVVKLKEMRDQLLFTSGALGFNVDEVRSLVDALGLSDTALSDFVTGLDEVTAAATAAADAAKLAALSASMPGGLSNTTPGGLTLDEAKRQRGLTIEALTLSAEDLAVFMREHGLDRNFMLNLMTLQKDISDNTRDETEDLGRIFGLWGSSLASFVDDIEAWLHGLEAVVAPWNPQNGPDPQAPPVDPVDVGVTHLPRPPINVNIYPLYGDPYAIGLSAANAVAMAAMLPGS